MVTNYKNTAILQRVANTALYVPAPDLAAPEAARFVFVATEAELPATLALADTFNKHFLGGFAFLQLVTQRDWTRLGPVLEGYFKSWPNVLIAWIASDRVPPMAILPADRTTGIVTDRTIIPMGRGLEIGVNAKCKVEIQASALLITQSQGTGKTPLALKAFPRGGSPRMLPLIGAGEKTASLTFPITEVGLPEGTGCGHFGLMTDNNDLIALNVDLRVHSAERSEIPGTVRINAHPFQIFDAAVTDEGTLAFRGCFDPFSLSRSFLAFDAVPQTGLPTRFRTTRGYRPHIVPHKSARLVFSESPNTGHVVGNSIKPQVFDLCLTPKGPFDLIVPQPKSMRKKKVRSTSI